MDLNAIIDSCAQECGIATCVYAEIGEANVLLDNIDDYPVLLRLFQGAIYEADNGLDGFVRRDLTLYFYDNLGIVEADTATKVAPTAERMISLAMRFIAALRRTGIDVVVRAIRPAAGNNYDAILAGAQCDLTVTYNAIC